MMRNKTKTNQYMSRQLLAGVLSMTVISATVVSGAAVAGNEFEATEGNDVVFVIKKPNENGTNRPLANALRYDFKTKNGKAKAGKDYTAAQGTVKFVYGNDSSTDATLSIKTLTDNVDEGDGERFRLVLTNPKVYTQAKGWHSILVVPQKIRLLGKILEQ